VRTIEGIQVDLRVVDPESFGAALVYFTGSKEHNIAIRELAKKNGLKINEYGVFSEQDERRVAGATEEDVYAALRLPYIPPECGEPGEIEAAMRGELPKLIERPQVRADLHVHSEWSDGNSSIEAMAAAARGRGLSIWRSRTIRKASGLPMG
jgi:DNA polymerase IV (family X)